MPASALTGRQALSGRNWGAFDVRTIACVRSATSWQRRQPGSRGRARRARTGLPVHERAPGHVSHSYNGPRPEGFGLGLLRLAEPTSFGTGDRRRRTAQVADLVLIPCRAATFDLEAIQTTLTLAELARKPGYVILN